MLGTARYAVMEPPDRFPVAPATPVPLAEIMNAAGPLMSAPSLTEDRGDHTEVWHCPPPDDGIKYQVIREEWTDDNTRHIHEWRPAGP